MNRRPIIDSNVVLPVKPDATLRIAAVADTHSSPHPKLRDRLALLRPDAILHAGDIGDRAVLERLGALAPVFAVRGNIDPASKSIPDLVTLDVVSNQHRLLRILLVHIALQGVRLRADVLALARERGAALVVCGHSHVPFLGRDREIDVFNPGSAGPRRFGLPIVFGMLELTAGRLHFGHVDCETGAPWSPRPSSIPSQGPT